MLLVSRSLKKYAEDSLPTLTLLVCMLGASFMVARLDLQGYTISFGALILSVSSFIFMCRQRSIARDRFRHWNEYRLSGLTTGQNIVFALVNGIGMTSMALSGMSGSLGLAVVSALISSAIIVFWMSVLHAHIEEAAEGKYAHQG